MGWSSSGDQLPRAKLFDRALVDDGLLLKRPLIRLGEERTEARGIQMRHGIASEIAQDHFRAGIACAPSGDETIGEPGWTGLRRKRCWY
jgi:hypothetical protein